MQVDRIFLSSTFLDFAWEREFLNTELVPALNEELRSEGREIDLLDLRWGVSRDAGLDNHAVDICMAEIRRSRTSGARPYFLYLGSDRPGWIPLPRLAPSSQSSAKRMTRPSGCSMSSTAPTPISSSPPASCVIARLSRICRASTGRRRRSASAA
jgi:hypothetical protein